LASIKEPVERYLANGGYLTGDEEPGVEVVRPSDLRLVPPAAVIRCLDDPTLWMLTVEGSSPSGPVIGLVAHPTELVPHRRGGHSDEVPPSAPEVTALLRLLGDEMVRGGHLTNPWTVYATAVRSEIWARTEELTDPTDRFLGCYLDDGSRLELPIRPTARRAAAPAAGALWR